MALKTDGRWNLRKALGLNQWTKDEIKELRTALGLSQAKFAKKLGVSRRVVAYWETGKKIPNRISEAKLEKLSQSLNCELTPPKPAPTLEKSLWQSSENIAWTPEAIQNLRRILGWTQQQLATALQTSQDIISQWEAGKYRPSEAHQKQLDQLATQLAKQEGFRQAEQVKLKSTGQTLSSILEELDLTEELFFSYLSVVAKNRYCYIYDDGSGRGWRTMFRWIDREKNKKRFFPVSNKEIAKHISPFYKDAIGLRAGFKTTYFDIDLDSNPDRYSMIMRMHEITHFMKHSDVDVYDVLILEREESGNLSIVGRCEPIKSYEMERCMKTILSCALEDPEEVGEPGKVEIYPSRKKARRLPFAGDQKIISEDSYTKIHPWSAIYESGSKSDDISRFLDLPPIDLKALAAALEELWGTKPKSKTPMYTKAYSSNEDSIHSASDFTLRCNWTRSNGLSDYGTRHEAETDLILFFWMLGYSEEECYAEISSWYKEGKTNGYSKEWKANPERVLRNLRSHIRSYYRYLNEKGFLPFLAEDAFDKEARLSYQDVYYIHQIAGSDLRFGEWLFDLMLYAKQRKVFHKRLFLSKETLRHEFKNGKEKYRDYLGKCISASLLSKVGNHCNFNTRFGIFRRPRVFKVNYDFLDAALLPKGVSYREALKEIYSEKQILRMFPKTTARRINKKWNKDKIFSLRIELGLTQKQFASELGVSERSVRYWEKGKCVPGSEILTKLDELDTSTSETSSAKAEKQKV